MLLLSLTATIRIPLSIPAAQAPHSPESQTLRFARHKDAVRDRVPADTRWARNERTVLLYQEA